MAALRKGGSFAAFTWTGKLPDPTGEEFTAALAQRRFRTIENAASEETSSGWVTPVDPTGDSFTPEDLDGGTGTWLRVRVDKKALPKKWLQAHRDAAEKATGKKLSARERRELKDDLCEKLLPRVLPTIAHVDALLFREKRLVLLFSTSKGAREVFAKLFFESFSLPLSELNTLALALRDATSSSVGAAIGKLEPTRWPRAKGVA